MNAPEPAGKTGPVPVAPAAVEYPPLPDGYVILDKATIEALTNRVALGQAEIDRLTDVLSRVPEEVRIKAEEASAKRKTKKVQTTITHWACFDASHRHQGELEAQGCIDAALGVPATEGT